MYLIRAIIMLSEPDGFGSFGPKPNGYRCLGPLSLGPIMLGYGIAAITLAWSPPSTYQQLLTIWWVPQQLLQKAVFDTFIFEEEGGGGPKILY